MIKVAAFSDGHGTLPEIQEPFDLLLIAGDSIDLYIQRHKERTISWYENDFVNWINQLPFKAEDSKVLWIAGNHEVGWEELKDKRFEIAKNVQSKTNNRAIYLEDSSYNFKGLTVYGTPWCKIFYNWAFMKNSDSLKASYSNIPVNCDILLTHDAPYGVSDVCLDWPKYEQRHIGNSELKDAILEKGPKINIHGHLHSANHEKEILGNTEVYCVSIKNEAYDDVYPILYLDL